MITPIFASVTGKPCPLNRMELQDFLNGGQQRRQVVQLSQKTTDPTSTTEQQSRLLAPWSIWGYFLSLLYFLTLPSATLTNQLIICPHQSHEYFEIISTHFIFPSPTTQIQAYLLYQSIKFRLSCIHSLLVPLRLKWFSKHF